MSQLNLKPAHAAVKTYYSALTQMGQLHFDNEAQVSDAFAKLLANCGRKLPHPLRPRVLCALCG